MPEPPVFSGSPQPPAAPPDPVFLGYLQPPDVPPDPTGESWRGLPGATGPAGPAGASSPYDISLFIAGLLRPGEILLRYVAPRAFQIAGGTGSGGNAATPATAPVVLSVGRNGTVFGTMTFAAGGTVAGVILATTSFAAGDVLSLTAQAAADATLADVGVVFSGSRI